MSPGIAVRFVDRKLELARFRRMLAGRTRERILLVLEAGEQGKTYFLLRLVHECERRDPPIPVVLLDFDQRRSGLTDYLSVAREVRRRLGDQHTPHICACEDEITRPRPLVNIQTGTGDAGVDWGDEGRFAEAHISDLAGRDSIDVRVGDVFGGVSPPDVAQQQVEMGRALCRDLAGLAAAHRCVVLLVDTFEHASSETCRWLEDWLFEPLRRELQHVHLVVAGRPECQSFFAHDRLWSDLVSSIERFAPLSDRDIRTYFRQRRLPVSEAELPGLLALARHSPARMALIGDWLMQVQGAAK